MSTRKPPFWHNGLQGFETSPGSFAVYLRPEYGTFGSAKGVRCWLDFVAAEDARKPVFARQNAERYENILDPTGKIWPGDLVTFSGYPNDPHPPKFKVRHLGGTWVLYRRPWEPEDGDDAREFAEILGGVACSPCHPLAVLEPGCLSVTHHQGCSDHCFLEVVVDR